MKIEAEDNWRTYAIRWVSADFVAGLELAATLKCKVEELPGFRLRRFKVYEEPGRGKAAGCSAFVDVTDKRVANPNELKVLVYSFD